MEPIQAAHSVKFAEQYLSNANVPKTHIYFKPRSHLFLPISTDSGEGPAARFPLRVLPVSKSWLVLYVHAILIHTTALKPNYGITHIVSSQ